MFLWVRVPISLASFLRNGERTDFPCLDPHMHSQFTIPGSEHCPSLLQTRTVFLFSSLMASPLVLEIWLGFRVQVWVVLVRLRPLELLFKDSCKK